MRRFVGDELLLPHILEKMSSRMPSIPELVLGFEAVPN